MISETPVYTLGSWTGNVTDAYGVDWVVTGEDGWSSSPPVRPTQTEKTSADGSWAGPGYYGARVISLTGTAIADDRITMLRAKERLKAAISARAQAELRVDEAHMSRLARVRLTDQIQITDTGGRAFTWSLILTAADPRRYSINALTQTAWLPSSSGAGRTYPRTYPYTYGGAVGGPGSVFFTQEGDYDETPATITFTGPLINPQVAHVQTGRSLAFALTLAAEEFLVVDLLQRSALLGGMASRAGTATPGSAWFHLVQGLNELQFRGQDPGTGTTPVMTVTAASAWT